MPDEQPKGGKKKNGTRTALIVAGVALAAGLAYFWWESRQGASGSGSSGSTGGTSATGGTDMGDIVQTVQGPAGPAGPAGKAGKTGKAGKSGAAHSCPSGMRWDYAQGKCVKAGVFGKAKPKTAKRRPVRKPKKKSHPG
jgi:hypothetical protein